LIFELARYSFIHASADRVGLRSPFTRRCHHGDELLLLGGDQGFSTGFND
jgi:hypothetical protein